MRSYIVQFWRGEAFSIDLE